MQNYRFSGVMPAEGALVDALCDEFEAALKGNGAQLEVFLARVESSLRPAAFREMLRVEVELRRARKEMVVAEDFMRRFPEFRQTIQDVCHVSDVVLATATFSPVRGRIEAELDTKSRLNTDTGRGRLEVRCPSCHVPASVAVDTALTSLTCSGCGDEFSLVNDRETNEAVPLATMGRFELISRLGMGAFGAVWKARDNELDRVVAIKIPRAGTATADDQEKFFREARAAAQLRHPNIVSVHEVGRDGDSVYIVSDFVRGMTLSDWLAGQQLTNREAAELCAKIADALDHAHEQGVVHRDLKPANIMIDEAGQPHIMDFGLARREVGEVTMTMEGHVLGTPAYMSPEQAQGESHKADRRSDVYSLGVILFQLLTRELPFRGNMRMVLQQVIQDEPPSPRKLNTNISKDLETITLKCLEKDPNRRYQSTADMATELRRYLAGEPILARPVSHAERAVRWVRRNALVSGLASAALLALVSGTIVSTYFAIDASHKAKLAFESASDAMTRQSETSAVLDFVEAKVFAAARPKSQEGGLGHDVTLRQAIDAAQPYIKESFRDQPLIEAHLREIVGRSYWYLGDAQAATDNIEKTCKILTKYLGPDDKNTLRCMSTLATGYYTLGRRDEAFKLNDEVFQRQKAKLGPAHPDTLVSMNNLANIYEELGRQQESLQTREEMLRIQKANYPADDEAVLQSMAELARSYLIFGRHAEAVELVELALRVHKEKFGLEHPGTLEFMNRVAGSYNAAGRFEDSMKLGKEVIALRKKVLGQNHPDTLESMHNLAETYLDAGLQAEAVKLGEELIPLQKTVIGPKHPQTIGSMVSLANAYDRIDRRNDALHLREVVLALQKQVFGDDSREALGGIQNLASSYDAAGRQAEALKLREDALPISRAKLALPDPVLLAAMQNLALSYDSAGRHLEAIQLREETAALTQAELGPTHPHTRNSMLRLATALALSPVDEVRNGKRAIEVASKAAEAMEFKDAAILSVLAAAHAEAQDFDAALTWAEKTLELIGDEGHPRFRKQIERQIDSYRAKRPFRSAARSTMDANDD